MTDEMLPPLPPLAVRVAELDRYVNARDIGWFREQHSAGSLAWLETHLGPSQYRALGSAIDSGDMDLVGGSLAEMDDATTVIDDPLAVVPTVVPPIGASTLRSGVVGDPLSSDLNDPTLLVSRGGAVLPAEAVRRERNTLVVTAIVLTLIAAGVVAYLLLRNNGDNASDTSTVTESSVAETIAADTVVGTIAVPSESVTSLASPTSVVVTTPPVPTTVPSNAAATVSVTAPPPKAAVPAPVVTVPLQDAVTTASRSATFGPYLAMVDAAGLTKEVQAMKNVTLLAPTESAFAALPTEVQFALRSPSNRDVLARIVRYGILRQSRSAAQLTPGNYATLEGSTVNVQLLDGTIRINDATITGKDVKVVNGVLHAVDRLLVPSSIDLVALVPNAPTPATAAPVRVTTAVPTTPVTAAPTAAPVTTAVPVVTANTPAPTSPATTSPPVTNAPTTRPPTTVA